MLHLIDQDGPELPSFGSTPETDTSKLATDQGDQAGLQPLPLGRMARQAGRLMSPRARGQDTPWYGRNTSLEVNPSLHDLTIQRNQRNQQTIENWDPIAAENKQRLNNTNPNPRSRPAAPGSSTMSDFTWNLRRTADWRRIKAFNEADKNDPRWSTPLSMEERRAINNQHYSTQEATPLHLFLTSKERHALKQMIFDHLDSQAKGSSKLTNTSLPIRVKADFKEFGNDMLYEWNARRQRQLRDRTLDMLEITHQSVREI